MPLKNIVVVEDQNQPGMGLFIVNGLQEAAHDSIRVKLIDFRLVKRYLEKFAPDVIMLDLDSLNNMSALNVSLDIRTARPNQMIIFMSEQPAPELMRDGLQAALWNRSYWLEGPSRSPLVVLPEILRAYQGINSINPTVVEESASEAVHLSKLSPQQHRVMRLMAIGYSNAAIAEECKISVKAVERTIAAASKILEVTPASKDTNHRVNAAIRYRSAMNLATEMHIR
jgi:DNA-binding NarL/FixJ family response regulator